jgi:hypothetical protein
MPNCNAPGCSKKVDAKSLTKCCRRHQHSEHCQCQTCITRRARAVRRAARTHVSTVLVPRPGFYQGDVTYDPVSVSRAPWEKETAKC